LKTFFSYNGFNRKDNLELRLESYHRRPRIRVDEYVPTLKEALLMADRSGSKRDRAIILTLITTGLRNSALRALRIGDVLTELESREKTLLIKVDPCWNERIAGACKGGMPYYTFAARVATEAIESMLQERRDVFGSFLPEEPLFISNYNQIAPAQRRCKPLTSSALRAVVHNTAKRADIPESDKVRVHSLRKVLDTLLRSPLADGTQMDHKDQEFLMGHTLEGSQEHYHDYFERTNVERMRKLHSKIVFDDTSSLQNLRLEVTRKIAKMVDLNVSDICAMKSLELGRPLTEEEEEQLLEQEIRIKNSERRLTREQKILDAEDLEEYLKLGWEFSAALPDGRIVISRERRPDQVK